MTPHEVAVFVAERNKEYLCRYILNLSQRSGYSVIVGIALKCVLLCAAFGFAAALLEATPFIGIFFSVSNRIGACMWAFGKSFLLFLFHRF